MHAGQRADARAHVAGALRVVRLRGEQPQRVTLRALEHRLVEALRIEREATGIAADFVERCQPEVAIERGVLDALRHHGPSGLLPPHDELVELR